MTGPDTTSDVAELSFEDALGQLEAIVSELERGETPLEQTIARFERGIALARRCEDRLNEADRKVAILLREGARVVEVDMQSGERQAVHQDPGREVAPEPLGRGATPSRAPNFTHEDGADDGPPAPPRRGAPRRGPGPPPQQQPGLDQGQMSLGQAFAIKDPAEMDDDDIPF